MKRNTISYQSGMLVLKHQSGDPENFELRVVGRVTTSGDMAHDGDFTIGENLYVDGYADISDDLTVRGNLFVKGDTVQVDSQISTADRVLIMNDGESGSGVTGGFSGIVIDRGSSQNYEFGFNETTDRFELGKEGSRQPVATRHPNPTNQALLVWNSSNNRLESTTANSARNWLQLSSLYYTKAEIDNMGGGGGSNVSSVSGDGNSSLVISSDDGTSVSTNLQHTHSNISLTAGNGLTGGGNLGSNRTITLGTPSTIGSGSTNSVSGSSHTHEIQLNSDDIPSLDWTNKVSGKPVGLDGQTYFFDGDGTNITNGYTMVSGRFVMNESQLMDEQQVTVSFGEIFDSWPRFSHSGTNNQPANLSETNSWRYNEDLDQIFSTVNSRTYIGMYSNQRYDRYTHEATIGATAGDDDPVGLVISFGLDYGDMVTNNLYQANESDYNWNINNQDPTVPKENTLSILRNRTYQTGYYIDGELAQYALVYNYRRSDQKLLVNGNDLVYNLHRAYQGNTCRVRVERDGDIIRVWTTDWTDAPDYDGVLKYPLEFNLNDYEGTQKLRGPQSYGYAAHSQANATYSDVEFTDPSGRIYDLSNDVSYTYIGDQWVQQSQSAQSEIGKGRFLFNPRYKSLNYINQDNEIEPIIESEIRIRGGYSSDYTMGDITFVGGNGIDITQSGNEIIISEQAQMQTFSMMSFSEPVEDNDGSYKAGIGLSLSNDNTFNIINPVNAIQISQWDTAYRERGSEIAGDGLNWERGKLSVSRPVTDELINLINDAHSWGDHREENYPNLGIGDNDVRSNSQLDVRYSRLKGDNRFNGQVSISNGNDHQLILKKSSGSGRVGIKFEHSDSFSNDLGEISFKPSGELIVTINDNDVINVDQGGNLDTAGNTHSSMFGTKLNTNDMTNISEHISIEDEKLIKMKIMKWMSQSTGTEDTGVDPLEVKEIFPTCVSEGNDGMYMVDYGKLAFHMISAFISNK